MKILVPIKRVPDYEAKIKLSPDGHKLALSGAKYVINPFDEIAVEEAVRLKERIGGSVEIVAVSIGPSETVEQLQPALAMGANRAILLETSAEVDSHLASLLLEKIVDKEQPDLLLMGKQAVDSDANQTGQLLAARLNWPQATFASKIELNLEGRQVDVVREVDGGLETLRLTLPAVITVDLRLNVPRYLSLPAIVMAKKKPLEKISATSLVATLTPMVEIRKLAIPGARKAGVKVQSVDDLLNKLQNEAKVSL